jgi:hypothetical protein
MQLLDGKNERDTSSAREGNRPAPRNCLLSRLNQSICSKWKEQLEKSIFLKAKRVETAAAGGYKLSAQPSSWQRLAKNSNPP